ncbi:MAG: SGNH/GDSL hydrolase family protein [Proteobacteria bacterium]|nr:SGNH/GDSL hydrolase family protein [Pseudomonadota bacterium]
MKSIRFALLLPLFILASSSHATTLIIGDSHTAGTFGKELYAALKESTSDSIELRGSCGSIIHWWYTGHETPCGYLEIDAKGTRTAATKAKTPLVETLLDSINPSRVVVALGANYLRGYPDATLTNDVKHLLRSIAETKARCFWIGPPDMRKFRTDIPAFVPKLEALVKPACTFIDSRALARYPDSGGDGVHFETPELKPIARSWAKEVAKTIAGAKPVR